jgi:hypothetical protein
MPLKIQAAGGLAVFDGSLGLGGGLITDFVLPIGPVALQPRVGFTMWDRSIYAWEPQSDRIGWLFFVSVGVNIFALDIRLP